MRSRIALFLAVAVVFAPGWHEQRPPQRLPGLDLARDLAPRAEGGTLREAVEVVKPQLNRAQTKRWRSGQSPAVPLALGLGGVALSVFFMLPIHLGSLFTLFRLRFRFSRAPPPFQPA